MAKVTIAELQAQLETATKLGAEMENSAIDASQKLAAVTGQRDAHAAEVKRLNAANASQAEQIRTLGGQLRAYKGSATKAKNEVLVLKAAKSPEARLIGALPTALRGHPGTSFEDAAAAGRAVQRVKFQDALREGPIELVFSDGKREIRELEPLLATGDAWREDARGFTLKFEPLLEPGEMTRPEVTIAGVAALSEAGEQLAWQRWVEPVKVPRNGRVQLTAGHIKFSL